jgi:hypothetical protein
MEGSMPFSQLQSMILSPPISDDVVIGRRFFQAM